MEITARENQRRIMLEAISTFGQFGQLGVLQEECAELIAAVSRYRRGRPNAEHNLVEELADVSIMVKEIILAINCDEAVEKKCEIKLKQLKKRIEKYQETAKED